MSSKKWERKIVFFQGGDIYSLSNIGVWDICKPRRAECIVHAAHSSCSEKTLCMRSTENIITGSTTKGSPRRHPGHRFVFSFSWLVFKQVGKVPLNTENPETSISPLFITLFFSFHDSTALLLFTIYPKHLYLSYTLLKSSKVKNFTSPLAVNGSNISAESWWGYWSRAVTQHLLGLALRCLGFSIIHFSGCATEHFKTGTSQTEWNCHEICLLQMIKYLP